MNRATWQFVKAAIVMIIGCQFYGRYTWLFVVHLAVAAFMVAMGLIILRDDQHAARNPPPGDCR